MEGADCILNHSPFDTLTNDDTRLKVEKGFRRFTTQPYTLMTERNHDIKQIGYICSGTLLYLSVAENGAVIRKGVAENGNYFGIESLMLNNGKALFDTLVVSPLECLVIEKQKFMEIVQEDEKLNFFFKELARERIDREFSGRQLLKTGGRQAIDKKQKLRVDKSIAFINANYTNRLTLDQLARQAGVSRYHFTRIFKLFTGQTFKDYLNVKRVEAAKRLLALPDVNVSQACYSVGFNDVSYFSRIFKRYEGVSPSRYKNKCCDRGKKIFFFDNRLHENLADA